MTGRFVGDLDLNPFIGISFAAGMVRMLNEGGTDYIYVIDMGGLRIAHFGDIGQPALTPEQAKALGRVDVAITQFDNAQFSPWDPTGLDGSG